MPTRPTPPSGGTETAADAAGRADARRDPQEVARRFHDLFAENVERMAARRTRGAGARQGD